MSDRLRKSLRKMFGYKYQAYPADIVEAVGYFIWLNDKTRKLN